MKKSTKWVLTGIAVVGISGVVLAKSFGPCSKDPNERADHIVERISDRLDITAEQKPYLLNLKQIVLDKFTNAKAQRADHIQELQSVLGESFDQEKALALISTKTADINTNAKEVIPAFAALYDSLSAEQREEVQEIVAHKLKRFSHHKER